MEASIGLECFAMFSLAFQYFGLSVTLSDAYMLCPGGYYSDKQIQTDIIADTGHMSCNPCKVCQEGTYRPEGTPDECLPCSTDCLKLNRHLISPCGGASPGICGECFEGYHSTLVDRKSHCVKADVIPETSYTDPCESVCPPFWDEGEGIDAAWKMGITGKGIIVAVTDVGVNVKHPELAANIDSDSCYNYVDDSVDVSPEEFPMYGESYQTTNHGNDCSSVIAGVKGNNLCSVGVAFNAKISAVKIGKVKATYWNFPGVTSKTMAKGLSHRFDKVDIYSNSWDFKQELRPIDSTIRSVIQNGTIQGRAGKGSIYVFPAGSVGSGHSNSIRVISVGSIGLLGTIPSTGFINSATLVSSFGEGRSRGADKFLTASKENSCSKSFRGVSAATAKMSGIVALVLEANPSLRWLDVQHVLVQSAERSGLLESLNFTPNAAENFFHPVFGFGFVNVTKAVMKAKTWLNVPPLLKQTLSFMVQSGDGKGNITTFQANTECDWYLRKVTMVILKCPSDFLKDVFKIILTSPLGTESVMMDMAQPSKKTHKALPLKSTHFWGEPSYGSWTLDVFGKTKKHMRPLFIYGHANKTVSANKPQIQSFGMDNKREYITQVETKGCTTSTNKTSVYVDLREELLISSINIVLREYDERKKAETQFQCDVDGASTNSRDNETLLNSQHEPDIVNGITLPNKQQEPESVNGDTQSNKQQEPESVNGDTQSNKQQEPESVTGITLPNKQQEPESVNGDTQSNKQQEPESVNGDTQSNKQQEPESVNGDTQSNKQQEPESVNGDTQSNKQQEPESVNGDTQSNKQKEPEIGYGDTQSNKQQEPESVNGITLPNKQQEPESVNGDTQSNKQQEPEIGYGDLLSNKEQEHEIVNDTDEILQALYSTGQGIRRLNATLSDDVLTTDLVVDTKGCMSFDVDYIEGILFWTNIEGSHSEIKRAFIKDNQPAYNIETILNLESVNAVAVDWVFKRIYWTEYSSHRIMASDYDGKNPFTIVFLDIVNPWTIAVDPENGIMYWTDWGENSKIDMCGMNGDCSNRHKNTLKQVDGQALGWPNGITIDFDGKRIFWTDTRLHKIGTADTNLHYANYIFETDFAIMSPFAISAFGETIFWSELKNKTIRSANKVTGKDIKTTYLGQDAIMDMKIYHKRRQHTALSVDTKSLCKDCNGMCFPVPRNLSSGVQVDCVESCEGDKIWTQCAHSYSLSDRSDYHDGVMLTQPPPPPSPPPPPQPPAIAVQLNGKQLTDKAVGIQIHHGQPFCTGYHFLIRVEPPTVARSLQIKNTVAGNYEIVSLKIETKDIGFYTNNFHKSNPLTNEGISILYQCINIMLAALLSVYLIVSE
ncbi:furin-like protease 1, isoforms 1/1-X/2 [Mya arenaria]|uniref:furin-like protease 1, isoforms 1/1-X/2 n=1 Tax=Mya arenaria TaxID=6604 RepID=UPI0022E7FAEB|nr:furin-like protease 1, isoforms 1/1-X/2 [Mya arenaria]